MDTQRLLFVSHSHQDDSFCLRLIADLRANLGEEAVWYDTSGGLHGGDKWWDRIVAEITERPFFLVVLSPHASESKWVPEEMAIAYRQKVELGKRLLPVRLADSPRREDWKGIQEFNFTQPDNPMRYAAELAELLHAIIPSLTDPVISAPSTAPAPATPERVLSPTERLTQETHTAYGLEHWSDVLDKTEILVERNAMTPLLWRERASAAFAIGDNNGGLRIIKQALQAGVDDADTLLLYVRLTVKAGDDNQAVEILTRAHALTALDDTATRLAILDELIAALARLKRWDDFARRVSDARRIAPNDIRWVLREIQRLLETGQFDEAIAAVPALPTGTDMTPLLSSWHTGIAAIVSKVTSPDDKNWYTFRALLDAAASAGVDPSIIARWRFEFPHFVPRVTLLGKGGDLGGGLVWSPNGARLTATTSNPKGVCVWDTASGRLFGIIPIFGIMAWAPDGKRIAAAKSDNRYSSERSVAPAGIWDTTSGQQTATLAPTVFSGIMQTLVGMVTNSNTTTWLDGVAWSPNGQWLAVLGRADSSIVQVWDVASSRLLTTLPVPDYTQVMEWSPDGAHIATSGDVRDSGSYGTHDVQKDVQMWEASNGHLLSAPSGIFRGTRAPMSWSPDGKRFAAVSEEGVRVWDTNSWHPLITLPPEDTGYGFVLVWSPDSIRLFIGGGNRDGAIWDAASGQKITTLVNSAHSKGLSWSTDGKRLVGASYWGPLIWDAATGQQIVIHGSVSNPVWSPDGTRFAAFDNKGKSVTIWGEE